MATGNGPTAKLCEWVCSTRYEDLPAEVRKETMTLLYDQVGCMVASATLPPCQLVVDLVQKLGGPGQCSIVGHPVRTSVTNAALANGTIGHGDEVDSTGQQGTGHYAATTVPATITVGQYVGASGKEFLRALALGSEVAARVRSLQQKHGTREQFSGGVAGAMGAAVNAGLLLDLDAEGMENALSLAAAGACGLSSHHLDVVKCLDCGRAAEAGVLSALLAQAGLHGPREIFTIESGFFDAFLGIPAAGHEMLEELGENYLMRQVAYKRYPVGGVDQIPLYALLKLLKAHELAADDLEQIEVSVSVGAFERGMANQHPSYHMETILSLAAVYGEITFSHIHDPRYLKDPRVKAFRERARILIVPRAGPVTSAERHAHLVLETGLTVRTRSGEMLHQELNYPLMSEDEIRQKFRSLMGLRLNSDRVVEIEQQLWSAEELQNVAPLIAELELPY